MNPPKPRVLVVVGSASEVPAWTAREFEVVPIDPESPQADQPAPAPVRAIVVWSSSVSPGHLRHLMELGQAEGVPVLVTQSGWAGAVRQAVRQDVHWFVDATHRAALAAGDAEILSVIADSWRGCAEREMGRSSKLARRVRKLQGRLERVMAVERQERQEAEQRVIAEIRRRAAELRRGHLQPEVDSTE